MFRFGGLEVVPVFTSTNSAACFAFKCVSCYMRALSLFQDVKTLPDGSFVLNLQKKDVTKVNVIDLWNFHVVTSFDGDYTIYQRSY